MARNKPEIITFKVEESLLEALKGLRNRSEFIRSAVLAALDNLCPLCKGTGMLTLDQKKHWRAFAANHLVEECDQCHELHLVCAVASQGEEHGEG